MRVLVVVDHPDPQAFTAACARSFAAGAEAAGYQIEYADLHAEGFDPRWTQRDARNVPAEDVLRERARIEKAEAICLVFPLFWWGMPAMMKGWVDRVWSWGWAYDQLGDRDQSLQPARTGVLLTPAGARSDEMARLGFSDALHTAWIDGTFGYFGFQPRQLEVLHGAEGSDARRRALLDRCYAVGAALPPPGTSR